MLKALLKKPALLRNVLLSFSIVLTSSSAVFASTPTIQQLEEFIHSNKEIFTRGRMEHDRRLVEHYLRDSKAVSDEDVVTVWQHALEVLQVQKGNRPSAFFSEKTNTKEDYGFQADDPTWVTLLASDQVINIKYLDDCGVYTHLVYSKSLSPCFIERLKETFLAQGKERNSFESYNLHSAHFRTRIYRINASHFT